MTLWRLHIRPSPQNGKTYDDVVNACISKNIAGIGWPISITPRNIQEYIERASQEYKPSISSISFSQKPKTSDLLWARDLYGVYYLGRIIGSWRYSDSPEDLELDIPNQIPCDWVKIGNEENVPGKIIACFRPSRTFQAIRDEQMEAFSQWLYNQKKQQSYYDSSLNFSEKIGVDEFFKLISSEDCEDIVGLYLQYRKNYLIIPSTCKSGTIGYEFILKHRETKKTAAVQVKQGYVGLDDSLSASADIIYLFSTEGTIEFDKKNIIPLDKEELYQFVLSNKDLLPAKILYWFNL